MRNEPQALTAAARRGPKEAAGTKPCNLCGTPQGRWLSHVNGYPLAQCDNCRLVYVSQYLGEEELRALYDDSYYHADDRTNPNETHWMTCTEGDGPLFDHVLNEVGRFQPGGALLDVGCSYGWLLLRARGRGYTPYGVELSRIPYEYCRDELKVPVFHGTLEQVNFPDSMFQVITMLNVLEHVPDVTSTLGAVNRLLAPGGLLALVVPNWVFGWPWIAANRHILRRENLSIGLAVFDVPRHLFLFSPRTVRSFLERTGFEVLKIYNAPVIRNQNRVKTAMKFGAKIAADVLYHLTLKRFVSGYSMAAIARKRGPASAP